MKIVTAKTAGFCMGVRRAVETALDTPAQHAGPIYTYGPLIHNPQIIDLLEQKGISILDEIPDQGTGTVLIRAHGVPPGDRDRLEAAGFTVIDATCPRVIKVQRIIIQFVKKGYTPIILGNATHPEVVGLLGHTGGAGHVVESLEQLEALPAFEKAIIVSQTTQNTQLFERVAQWTARNRPHYKLFNTICDSTEKRQAEIKALADSVDAVVVVGGRSSGNTKRLAEIARQSGKPAYHVETEADLDLEALKSAHAVGITAGASTPNWIMRRVLQAIEDLPYRHSRGLRRSLFNLQRTLLLTSLYLCVGAGSLAYACSRLQEISGNRIFVLIAMSYVLSMHILNNIFGIKADLYNDPERAAFYTDHKKILAVIAGVAGFAGLAAAFAAGWTPFVLLLVMTLLGLSYKLSLVPRRLFGGRYRRLSDIPGSKTTLISLAWGVVAAALPALAAGHGISLKTLLVFIWCGGLVFARTVFFEIIDIHGDRLVGRETIPLLIGEQRAMKLLKSLLLALPFFLGISSLLGLLPSLGYILAACSALMYALIVAYERGLRPRGIRFELLVDFHFILTGLAAFLWSRLAAGM